MVNKLAKLILEDMSLYDVMCLRKDLYEGNIERLIDERLKHGKRGVNMTKYEQLPEEKKKQVKIFGWIAAVLVVFLIIYVVVRFVI